MVGPVRHESSRIEQILTAASFRSYAPAVESLPARVMVCQNACDYHPMTGALKIPASSGVGGIREPLVLNTRPVGGDEVAD
jgi:hypothetical protein